MPVNAVNQENKYYNNAKASLAVGAVATGIQAILLPKEAKGILKIAAKGEDTFVKAIKEQAQAMPEYVKAVKENTNVIIDGMEEYTKEGFIESVAAKAKENFPLLKEEAWQIIKGLGGIFATVAASVFVMRTLFDKYDDYKMKKAESIK